MITQQQALDFNHFHFTGMNGRGKAECIRTVGPRGGVKTRIIEVRRSGKTKLWKTRPTEFSLPVKFGLYESTYITHDNAGDWHTPEDCPINVEA
jgi:hypothetical protein